VQRNKGDRPKQARYSEQHIEWGKPSKAIGEKVCEFTQGNHINNQCFFAKVVVCQMMNIVSFE
jgi:hypothetical protein